MLVRARMNRRLANGRKLFETLASGPAAGRVRIEIKKVTARPKSQGKQARPGRSYRIADAEVRFRRVTLPATAQEADPVTMYGVHIREQVPPEDEEAITWYLLTSVAVHTLEEALQVLDHYVKRWRIEDFFRVLKSGCKVERLALRTALRLERAIAIYCVIAWRLMVLTLLGRTVPELDSEVFFTELELRFLKGYASRVKLPRPGKFQEAILLVAVLGGYQNRTRDGPARSPDHVARAGAIGARRSSSHTEGLCQPCEYKFQEAILLVAARGVPESHSRARSPDHVARAGAIGAGTLGYEVLRRVRAALRCDNPWTVILSQGRIPIPCRGFMSTVSKASARKAGVARVEPNEASLNDQALSPQPKPPVPHGHPPCRSATTGHASDALKCISLPANLGKRQA